MDMSILDTVFSMVSCPQCYCTSLNLVQNEKQGLSFEMKLVCGSIDCDWCHIFWTSKKISKNDDVNRRIFYSMRRIGNGFAGMKRFLFLMKYLLPGDVILAGRGFDIWDSAALFGATVEKPASTKGKKQLSAFDVRKELETSFSSCSCGTCYWFATQKICDFARNTTVGLAYEKGKRMVST